MIDQDRNAQIATVRRFNRFYTRHVGVLEEGYLNSPFSLAEARVLYEITQRDAITASEIAKRLGLDAGYLSRILRGFETRGLINRYASDSDARQSLISPTARGRQRFAPLEALTIDSVGAMLAALSPSDQERIIGAMTTIESVLDDGIPAVPYMLRPQRAGDLGWVVSRHGALYAREHQWGERFEALCAQIVADFVHAHEPGRERCWIAERNGVNVGSVFLVKHSDRVAKLRLLLVEPEARGCGIGKGLVNECIRFAEDTGYRKITLWTQSILSKARALYQSAGFERVASEPHRRFGVDLIGETWERKL